MKFRTDMIALDFDCAHYRKSFLTTEAFLRSRKPCFYDIILSKRVKWPPSEEQLCFRSNYESCFILVSRDIRGKADTCPLSLWPIYTIATNRGTCKPVLQY